MLKIKRIYEPAQKDDGYRILVDRLWPRGVSKQTADLDLWLKEIGPSHELRKWFDHDPNKWPEFIKKYKAELHQNPQLLSQLKSLTKEHSIITLLYAARDTEHNEAIILQKILS